MIREGEFDHESILALVEAHNIHCTTDTDCCKAHRLGLEDLRADNIRFWTLWDADRAVGMIALRDLSDGKGEIKSMHILSQRRGGQDAKALLDHLIHEARASDITWLGLETGDSPMFERAVRFYEKNGFEPISAFADYTPENAGLLFARSI